MLAGSFASRAAPCKDTRTRRPAPRTRSVQRSSEAPTESYRQTFDRVAQHRQLSGGRAAVHLPVSPGVRKASSRLSRSVSCVAQLFTRATTHVRKSWAAAAPRSAPRPRSTHTTAGLGALGLSALGLGLVQRGLLRWRSRRNAHRQLPAPMGTSGVDINIVTFNIRGISDRWPEREPFLKECLQTSDADVVCFQEVLTGEFRQDQQLLGPGYDVLECRAALSNLSASGGASAAVAAAMRTGASFSPTCYFMVRWPLWLESWREAYSVKHPLPQVLKDLSVAPFFGNSIACRLQGLQQGSHEVLVLGGFRAAQRTCIQLPARAQEHTAGGSEAAAGGSQQGADGRADSAPDGAASGAAGLGQVLWVVNTHLDHAEPLTRANQVLAICEWMEPCLGSGGAVVITGDLNAPPDEAAHTIFEQHGYQSAHRVAHGQEPPVTWPSGLQAPLMDEGEPHCADYVYVRGGQGCGLEVVAAQLVGQEPHPEDKTLYPSDHVGLKVMVRVGATG